MYLDCKLNVHKRLFIILCLLYKFVLQYNLFKENRMKPLKVFIYLVICVINNVQKTWTALKCTFSFCKQNLVSSFFLFELTGVKCDLALA